MTAYTAYSRLRGHEIYHDGNQWRYVDTDTPTKTHIRSCGACGQGDTPQGHDPCLGSLPGIMNACCGHGNPREAYIQFENGMIVRGFDEVDTP